MQHAGRMAGDQCRETKLLFPLYFLLEAFYLVFSTTLFVLQCLVTFVRLRWYAAKFPVVGGAYPIFGHSLVPLKGQGIFEYLFPRVQEHTSGTFRASILPLFYVHDPRDIEKIIGHPKCNKKARPYYMIKDGIGDGLITASGDTWKRHYKIIGPSFHPKVLDTYVPIYNRQSDVFIKIMESCVGPEPFDMMPMAEHLSLDIISEAAMGVNLKSQINDEFSAFTSAITCGQNIILQRYFSPWLYPGWIFKRSQMGKRQDKYQKVVCDVVNFMLEKRRRELNEAQENENDNYTDEKRRLFFLDHLLMAAKEGAPISDEEITTEVLHITAAGQDTSALLVAYCCYELARTPEVQDKIIEELESLFDPTLETIEVTPGDLGRMPYMEMVLKETLRMHPSVPLIARLVEEDIILPSCNRILPKGADVIIVFTATHRNPDIYPDPAKFDPDRFLPENEKARHPFAYMPFSAGQRNCIGKRVGMMETMTVMAKVVWHFRIFPDPTFVPKDEFGISLKPTNGMRIRLEKRLRK